MNKVDLCFAIGFFALVCCFIGLGVGNSLHVCEYNATFIQETSKLVLALSGGYLAHRAYCLNLNNKREEKK